MMKMLRRIALVVGGLAWTAPVQGATIVLDFEGLGNLEAVNGFYNGGTGSLGSGPGTNYGISFTRTSLAIIDADGGGSGPVPEPASLLLLGSGLIGVAGLVRRYRYRSGINNHSSWRASDAARRHEQQSRNVREPSMKNGIAV